MTQVQLAESLGVQQSFISALETGRRRIDEARADELRQLLGEHLDEDEATEPQTISTWEPAPLALPLPITVRRWARSLPSGDVFECLPLPGRAVLVAAIDIAGHGEEASRPATYIAGWLRGWASALVASPRLESCADALRSALGVISQDAAWFLAVIAPVGDHAVDYTGRAEGFPSPLLMVNSGVSTVESASPNRDASVHHSGLSAPWKLVVASDGLLERLGAGHEREGKRSLLRWQSARTRNSPIGSHLGEMTPQTDDETLMILQWDGWDLELELDVSADAVRERRLEEASRWTRQQLRVTEAADAFVGAIEEAIDNADRHGYGGGAGKVVVRLRAEPVRIRAQVVDHGFWRGQKIVEGGGFASMRDAVSRVDFCRVYPQGMSVSLVMER